MPKYEDTTTDDDCPKNVERFFNSFIITSELHSVENVINKFSLARSFCKINAALASWRRRAITVIRKYIDLGKIASIALFVAPERDTLLTY